MSNAGKGSTIGGLIGGAAGSIIPGVGTTIGAGLGSSIGGLIGGKVDKKKAEGMLPGDENPEQRALMRQYARQKRAFQTGTANKSAMNSLNSTNKQGINAAMKYGKGSGGLNTINQMYQQGLSGIQEGNQQGINDNTKAQGEVLNTLAQRKLELGMERYDKASAEATQATTDAKRNLGSTLARMSGGDIEKLNLLKKKKLSTDGGVKSVSGAFAIGKPF